MNQRPICDYENSDYQQTFWDSGTRRYEDLCEARAIRRLLPRRGARLLELGAGAGRNSLRYSGYENLVLLDYSRTQLRQARERLGGSGRFLYVAADVYNIPFASGLFDAATMIRTLHHMSDPPAALREVRRVLAPQSTFLLEYANKRNLKAILRYLLRRQDVESILPGIGGVFAVEFRFPPPFGPRLAGEQRVPDPRSGDRLSFPDRPSEKGGSRRNTRIPGFPARPHGKSLAVFAKRVCPGAIGFFRSGGTGGFLPVPELRQSGIAGRAAAFRGMPGLWEVQSALYDPGRDLRL